MLHRLSTIVGYAAVLLACVVLVGGWGLGISSLKSVIPGLGTMKANAALVIGALGSVLALGSDGRWPRTLGNAAASVALAFGLLTLAEYAFHWDAGIDQLLFKDPDTAPGEFPGRPAIATAITIALLGAAQLAALHPAIHRMKTPGAIAASLIAWAALSGYVFGPQALSEAPLFGSVGLHTAAIILLLSVGILAAEPMSWPLRTAFAKGTGGTVCRWLVPPAVLTPLILGWLLNHASVVAVYPDPFRWALYAVASSLGAVWLIMLLAHRIEVIDAERTAATELSLLDSLTGLANRRAFDSFLLERFNLARRHNHALSLIMLDIDQFKSYNDDYGHPAGDELLRNMGALLASLVRETDLVARLGGEEFAVVLPQTDLAGARVMAERVRAEVERSSLFRRQVTVSVGISMMTGSTVSTSLLVHDCDAALYRAKAAGRNRVSAATESG